MNQQALSPRTHAVDQALSVSEPGGLTEFWQRQAVRQLAEEGIPTWDYALYAVRTKPQEHKGAEVFGPQRIQLGRPSEEILYGQHRSPFFRFRAEAKRLADRVQNWLATEDNLLEWAHQATLIWSEVGLLKDFLGSEDEMDELIAELRTARYQFLGKDTPAAAAQALGEVFGWIAEAPILDLGLVDRVIERLEAIGVDTFAQDALNGRSGA